MAFSKGYTKDKKSQPPEAMRQAAAIVHKPKAQPPKAAKPAKGPTSAFNGAPAGDNRKGRMTPVKTDRGNFTFKSNRKGD